MHYFLKTFVLIFLSTFIFSPAFASDTDCVALDDELGAIVKDFEERMPEIENKETLSEADQKKFRRYEEIVNYVGGCGKEFPDFYDHAQRICMMYSMNKPDEFEKYGLPLCEEAMFSKDKFHSGLSFENVIRFYLKAGNPHRNFQKAIYYIDKFSEDHEDGGGVQLYKTFILRRGGFGVEKDEKAAFKIVKELAEKSGGTCQLSLYYRYGIGTEKDLKKADELLAKYHEAKPDAQCDFMDMGFFFGEKDISKELVQEIADDTQKSID